MIHLHSLCALVAENPFPDLLEKLFGWLKIGVCGICSVNATNKDGTVFPTKASGKRNAPFFPGLANFCVHFCSSITIIGVFWQYEFITMKHSLLGFADILDGYQACKLQQGAIIRFTYCHHLELLSNSYLMHYYAHVQDKCMKLKKLSGLLVPN